MQIEVAQIKKNEVDNNKMKKKRLVIILYSDCSVPLSSFRRYNIAKNAATNKRLNEMFIETAVKRERERERERTGKESKVAV